MSQNTNGKPKIGYLEAVSIGIGGMVGGGIFAVLGYSAELSRGGTPISFLIAGLVALITAYSYAKLSVRYPSSGGTIEFLNQGLKSPSISGALNMLLWISYVVMLSLYSHAFGSYGATFFPEGNQTVWKHVLISSSIIAFTLVNFLNVKFVGKSEEVMIFLKIGILLIFVSVGFWGMNSSNLAPETWGAPFSIIAGGMIIFLAYEGFELIANTAHDVKNPKKILPRAFYTSVLFVIGLYVSIAMVMIGNLSLEDIANSRDYALAESAKPFFGDVGFVIIAIAALLSTSSAINATLYGSAKISYVLAKMGKIPILLKRKMWTKPVEGLLITSGLTMIISNLFDLSSIAMMGSSGFLIIFTAVNWSNFRLYKETKSKRPLSLLGAVGCMGALFVLIFESFRLSSSDIWILVGIVACAFGVEFVYGRISKRRMKPQF